MLSGWMCIARQINGILAFHAKCADLRCAGKTLDRVEGFLLRPYDVRSVPSVRILHTRPAMTWTAVSTIIWSHQQAVGNLSSE